jgi:START-like superfamily domain
MSKFKFTAEFEFKASPKVLFQYISQASALEQWFAKKVLTRGTNKFDLQWDGESHLAKHSIIKLNKQSKFDFENGNYVDFRIDVSDLTNTTYMTIIDYSDNNDVEDLKDIWEDLIYKLKEIVGH